MSVIVGIKKDGKVYLGTDSQISCGPTKFQITNKNNYKIWAVKNVPNCLMGCVGRFRDACIVRVIEDLVDELTILHGEVNYEYVVTNIVPHLFYAMRECGFIKADDLNELESAFLFAYQDQLYYIYSDGGVVEVDDCIAIGSGQENAYGSLQATKKVKNVNSRIIQAVEAAGDHNLYVSGDVIVANTWDCKFNVIKPIEDN